MVRLDLKSASVGKTMMFASRLFQNLLLAEGKQKTKCALFLPCFSSI